MPRRRQKKKKGLISSNLQIRRSTLGLEKKIHYRFSPCNKQDSKLWNYGFLNQFHHPDLQHIINVSMPFHSLANFGVRSPVLPSFLSELLSPHSGDQIREFWLVNPSTPLLCPGVMASWKLIDGSSCLSCFHGHDRKERERDFVIVTIHKKACSLTVTICGCAFLLRGFGDPPPAFQNLTFSR